MLSILCIKWTFAEGYGEIFGTEKTARLSIKKAAFGPLSHHGRRGRRQPLLILYEPNFIWHLVAVDHRKFEVEEHARCPNIAVVPCAHGSPVLVPTLYSGVCRYTLARRYMWGENNRQRYL